MLSNNHRLIVSARTILDTPPTRLAVVRAVHIPLYDPKTENNHEPTYVFPSLAKRNPLTHTQSVHLALFTTVPLGQTCVQTMAPFCSHQNSWDLISVTKISKNIVCKCKLINDFNVDPSPTF